MGLFDKFSLNVMDLEEQMTKEDLDQMEKDGCDVTELRAKLERKYMEQKAVETKRTEAIHLEKLDAYKATPRRTDTPFFMELAGKSPSDNQNYKIQYSELIYAAVVQANSDLWEPGSGEYLPAVVVYTNDKDLRYDIQWLKQIAEKISSLKDSKDVPEDCKKFIKTLKDDQSMFHYKVGSSIAGNADVWCETFNFPKQSNLPNSCLPPNGILPFLFFSNELVEGRHNIFQHNLLTPLLFGNKNSTGVIIEIPGKYYI